MKKTIALLIAIVGLLFSEGMISSANADHYRRSCYRPWGGYHRTYYGPARGYYSYPRYYYDYGYYSAPVVYYDYGC